MVTPNRQSRRFAGARASRGFPREFVLENEGKERILCNLSIFYYVVSQIWGPSEKAEAGGNHPPTCRRAWVLVLHILETFFLLTSCMVPWRTISSWRRKHRTRTTLWGENLWPISVENHHQTLICSLSQVFTSKCAMSSSTRSLRQKPVTEIRSESADDFQPKLVTVFFISKCGPSAMSSI